MNRQTNNKNKVKKILKFNLKFNIFKNKINIIKEYFNFAFTKGKPLTRYNLSLFYIELGCVNNIRGFILNFLSV